MNIDLRRIKGTPYKIVLSDWKVLGIFKQESGKEKFIHRDSMNEDQRKITDLLHANTFAERLASV